MRNDQLSVQSMDFAVSIINLVKDLKLKHESVISNQIGRSGTSIGANIREAQYAHGKADFIAKLQIALKEANETGYWLELLCKTGYINEQEYKSLDSACASIRVMLISSIKTGFRKFWFKALIFYQWLRNFVLKVLQHRRHLQKPRR